MDTFDAEWLQQRIDATKALILKYEEALLALAGGAQSYSLDTGQSRQVVTKADLASLRIALDDLENRLSTLQLRLNGNGTRVIPAF